MNKKAMEVLNEIFSKRNHLWAKCEQNCPRNKKTRGAETLLFYNGGR